MGSSVQLLRADASNLMACGDMVAVMMYCVFCANAMEPMDTVLVWVSLMPPVYWSWYVTVMLMAWFVVDTGTTMNGSPTCTAVEFNA